MKFGGRRRAQGEWLREQETKFSMIYGAMVAPGHLGPDLVVARDAFRAWTDEYQRSATSIVDFLSAYRLRREPFPMSLHILESGTSGPPFFLPVPQDEQWGPPVATAPIVMPPHWLAADIRNAMPASPDQELSADLFVCKRGFWMNCATASTTFTIPWERILDLRLVDGDSPALQAIQATYLAWTSPEGDERVCLVSKVHGPRIISVSDHLRSGA